jgi:hypothetical protein
VLDEWNHDGMIVIGTVLDGAAPRACTGVVAEQAGRLIPGQYLPGGGRQAILSFDAALASELDAMATLAESGATQTRVIDNISWEVRPTGWIDANGVHGYALIPGPGVVATTRLGANQLRQRDAE